MTRRQVVLFYNQAVRRDQLQQAMLIDGIHAALHGTGSPLAQQIRENK